MNSIEISRATEGVEQGGSILQKIEELQKQVLNMEKQNMASNQSYERSIIAQEKFFEEHRQKEVSENISVALNKLDIVLNSIEVSKPTEGGEQGGLILQKIEELQKQVLNMEKQNMAVSKKLDTIEHSNHDYNQKMNQLVSQHHGDVNVHGTYAVS